MNKVTVEVYSPDHEGRSEEERLWYLDRIPDELEIYDDDKAEIKFIPGKNKYHRMLTVQSNKPTDEIIKAIENTLTSLKLFGRLLNKAICSCLQRETE